VGKAGQEKDTYKARHRLRLLPQYTTNIVKCRPPGNRDPEPEEILACTPHLLEEIEKAPGDLVIGALGRFAASAFIPDLDMDMMHSIPQRYHANPNWIIVPIYHPALGLYSTRFMTQIDQGFKAVADVVEGLIKPEDWNDLYPEPVYQEYRTGHKIPRPEVVFVDTETVHLEP
jgi:DNA polymerase